MITRVVSDNNNPNVPKYGYVPWNPAQWVELADRLRVYAELETSFFLDPFPLSYGYSVYKFKKQWKAHNEYFADAVEYAIQAINYRRNEMLAFSTELIDRKDWLDKRPLYDAEFREWRIEEKQASKPEVLTGAEKIVVEYMKVPSDDRVKPLKDDECQNKQ